MTKRVGDILNTLRETYPDAVCELDYGTPFQLLVSVILSAQCTDVRVNKVTDILYKKYSMPADFAEIDIDVLKKEIYSCGFYNMKAKHIKQASKDIIERFGGEVPDNLTDLQSLAGVGRKTANVVYAVAFKGQAIAVDTHVFRVANRIGLANSSNVLGTEKQLMQAIASEMHSRAHHLLLFHGRYTCKSQRPQCERCGLTRYCKYFKNHPVSLSAATPP